MGCDGSCAGSESGWGIPVLAPSLTGSVAWASPPLQASVFSVVRRLPVRAAARLTQCAQPQRAQELHGGHTDRRACLLRGTVTSAPN